MSSQELKIWGELEKDIERELEEEIKDGICRLAQRLHRLYQHQIERNSKESSYKKNGVKVDDQQGKNKKNVVSEVNINIKMGGGTKIEIKKMKKQDGDNRVKINYPKNTKINYPKQGKAGATSKRFDWVNSLRSGPNSLSIDTKIEGSCHCKTHAKTGKFSSSDQQKQQQQQHMVNNKGDKNMLLELGWKD